MRQVGRVLVAFCVVGLVNLGAGLSAVESHGKERTTRPARLYFLREKGLLSGLAPDVKVDGKTVGTVGNGAYVVIERPPGLHQLAVGNPLSMDFETEVQVEAGQSYYFNIAPRASGAPLQDLAVFALVGGKGQPMQAKSPLRAALAGPIFYRLEPAAGAVEIERLKAP
jgi:hypothetical protein